MAWHHVEDQTHTIPRNVTRLVQVMKTYPDGRRKIIDMNVVTSEPSGSTFEMTYSIWRCGNCRALATGEQGVKPSGPCGKCGARG